MSMVPRGIYRNRLGVTMQVGGSAGQVARVLSDDIRVGVVKDDLFGDTAFLVTAKSLADAGYEPVLGEPGDPRRLCEDMAPTAPTKDPS